MSENERCVNCIHCHKTKELVSKEWKQYYLCTLWLDIGEEEEPLLLTLGSENDVQNDLCECFSGGKEE